MDGATLKNHLDDAERDLAKAHRSVEQQRTLIERMRAQGHDTKTAESMLTTFEHSAHAMEHHRNVLLEELGLYKMGESKGSDA